MRAMFSPELVNPPFGDPGLFVDFNFESRALQFDLGDIAALAPRKILRITDAFITHTHMDHFAGFDLLLRICLGRPTSIRLYGPPGFAAQVEHKLAAYTWNLVENYPGDFFIDAWEVDPHWRATGLRMRCRRRFASEPLPPMECPGGVLRDEPGFRVRAAFLDHGIPSLGFALDEKVHVNVWKSQLADLGLSVGPWLKALKDAVMRGEPGETTIVAVTTGGEQRALPVDLLKREVLQLVPGEKIVYVTDVAFTDDNLQRIAALGRDATQLFIESPFLDEDADHARRKKHLTAGQAGAIARAARAKRVIPFHFSPRYSEREGELREQVDAAWSGRSALATAAR